MKAVTRLHITSLTSNQAMQCNVLVFFLQILRADGGILRANMKTTAVARVPRLGIAAYCHTPNAAASLLMVASLETFSNLRPVSRRDEKPRLAIVGNGKYNLG